MNLNNLISVISVNYNGYYDTCNFIDSWTSIISSFRYEIIIIDNGSEIDESILIKNRYPNIITYRSEKNLGFAGANNIGIKLAKGNILFFLNNDTLIINDTLPQFLKKLDYNKVAGISPVILDQDKDFSIQFAGYTELSEITLRNKALTYFKDDNRSIKTAFLHGAAMAFKREAIENVGIMNEDYFLYYEEFDWCEKFKKKGYEIYVEPSFKIVHKNSGTIGLNSPIKAYYLTRNRLLFAYNNRSKYKLFFIILYHLSIAYPYHFIKALIYGKKEIAKAEIRGIIDYFKITI